MDITKEEIWETAKAILVIFGSVYLFGKLVEQNTDVDKNWEDYLKTLKKGR
jgi:hypothetical protein